METIKSTAQVLLPPIGSAWGLTSPRVCPECGADLLQPGSVHYWNEMPEHAVAHLEESLAGVIVVLDGAHSMPIQYLQCSECGTDISLNIEDVDVDPFFEETEMDD